MKEIDNQALASMGRFGDTIVAHINPHEAAVLKMMGGAGTINPHTGLPEYFTINSINPMGSGRFYTTISTDQGNFVYVPQEFVYKGLRQGNTQFFDQSFLNRNYLAALNPVRLNSNQVTSNLANAGYQDPSNGFLIKESDYNKFDVNPGSVGSYEAIGKFAGTMQGIGEKGGQLVYSFSGSGGSNYGVIGSDGTPYETTVTVSTKKGGGILGDLGRLVRRVAPFAAIVVAVFAPELIPILGESILRAGASATATTAAGAAAISATGTAVTGGSLEDIAKSAATAAVSAGVGSNVSGAVSSSMASAGIPAAAANLAGQITGAAAGAAATGGNVEQAITNAAITGGATTAYRELTSTPPTLTQPPAPPSAATEGTTDYSLAAGLKFPGQGLKTPELAPLPGAETIGNIPIDYGNIFAPSAPSTGYKTPALQQLPPAEQIGTKTIDYQNILTPETRNLPEMGGGTGLTARDETGAVIGVDPRETSVLKQAGEVATRLLAGEYARSLSDREPSRGGTSTLDSTGLFTPSSIVPTALTGIAPSARGAPIFGGEDEEATGAWGAKTLRG